MTMLLAARAIERIGDNAVDIGEQVAFVVTGLFREFEDASHPSGGRAGRGGVPCESPHSCGLKGSFREVLQCFLRGTPPRPLCLPLG